MCYHPSNFDLGMLNDKERSIWNSFNPEWGSRANAEAAAEAVKKFRNDNTTRVAVDKGAMERNASKGTFDPVFAVFKPREVVPTMAHEVYFEAGSQLVYNPIAPMKQGGTTAWMESKGQVVTTLLAEPRRVA